MNDHPDDSAQLAAWLAGDLDDAESAALERRLDAEPALGARLDSLAATLARLRRYDTVELPSDAAARLRTRLRTERAGSTDHDTRRTAPAGGTSGDAPLDLTSSAAAATARPGTGNGSTPPTASTDSPRPAGGAAGAHTAGGRASTHPADQAGSTRPPGAAARRPGRRRRLSTLAGVAAAVLVVVVGVGALLPQLTRGGEDAASSGAADMEVAAQDQQSASEEAPAEASSESAIEQAAGDTAAAEEERALAEPAPTGPVVVDAGAPLAFAETADAPTAAAEAEDALATRFLAVPEAEALIGLPVEEAREVARAFVTELQAAPALTSVGIAPSACLDTVATEDTAVPARVEAFRLDGSPAVAYVVVRATPGSPVLDAIQVVVTDPRTCTVLAGS